MITTLTLSTFCSLALVCSRSKTTLPASDSTATVAPSNPNLSATHRSIFISPDSSYCIHLPAGYSVHDADCDGQHLIIGCGNERDVHVDVLKFDSYYLQMAMRFDKSDTLKGFAMARAHEGPPADTRDEEKTIDSVFEFKNTFGLRSLRIEANVHFKLELADSSSYPYEGYYVNISQRSKMQIIEILHSFENPRLIDICRGIAMSIDRVPVAH